MLKAPVSVEPQGSTSSDAQAPDLATRRRAEILSGSIRIIARDGVASAKLKDIARESGVSLGLIQHYFDTKEELVNSTFEVMMHAIVMANEVDDLDQEPPLVTLLARVRLHVFGNISFDERWHFWAELWSSAGRSPAIREVSTRVYALWAEPVTDALMRLADARIISPDLDIRQMTDAVLALLDGFSVRTIIEPGTLAPEELYSRLTFATTRLLGIDEATTSRAIARIAELPEDPRSQALTPELLARVLMRS
ncbi:MAG: TetR/AcrR family transcriptional regulator [Leucobacter sp.]